MSAKELLVYVKPTERCNLNCLHCYNSTGDTQSTLDLERLREFLLRSAPLIEQGSTDYNIEVVLHGGEPTLVGSEYLRKVLNIFRTALPTCTIAPSMQSNLVSVSADMVEFIKTELHSYIGTSYSPGLRFVGRDSDKLQDWYHNIQEFVSQGIRVYIVISLGAWAIRTLDPNILLQTLLDLKVDGFHFEPITKNGNALLNTTEIDYTPLEYDIWKSRFTDIFIKTGAYEHIGNSEIIRKAKSFTDKVFIGCSCRDCMRKTFTINSDGSVGACPNDSKINILGSLSDTLETLLTNPVRSKLITKERFKRLDCITCPYITVCNGGCMQLQDCYEGRTFFSTLESGLRDNIKFRKAVDAYTRTSIFN